MKKTLLTSLEHLFGDTMSTAQLNSQNICCLEDRHLGLKHKHTEIYDSIKLYYSSGRIITSKLIELYSI